MAIPIDADEYINIKTDDRTLQALAMAMALPVAHTLSMTWRFFRSAGVKPTKPDF